MNVYILRRGGVGGGAGNGTQSSTYKTAYVLHAYIHPLRTLKL